MQFLYLLCFSKGCFNLRTDREGIEPQFGTNKNIAQNYVAENAKSGFWENTLQYL